MSRDITEKQYIAALERRGFRPCGAGRMWVVHEDFPNIMFGTFYDFKKKRVLRRATIAKVIKDLDRARAQEKEKGARSS